MHNAIKNSLGTVVVAAVLLGTAGAVRHFHRPGQLDVLTAQAMDMSQMRPPTGAAPVALASVRRGSLADTLTYTGTVAAFNEQDISPRITGTLASLTVYPGDTVRAGQVVAQLDTAEVGAKAQQARDEAQQAQIGAQVAHLTHHLHHRAALAQASAQVQVARQSILDAQAEAQAAHSTVADAEAGVQSAQANARYWQSEIVREKQLADAGAASQQEYQSEQAQADAAQAALTQAQAKVAQARAAANAAQARVLVSRRQADAVREGVQMAQADIAVAEGQAAQAEAGASAAGQAARVATVQQGYGRIASPFGGVVTARPVAPGTLVQPGTTLLRIAQIDRVRVQASVAASDLPGLRVGSPVTITVPGSRAFTSRITSVFPSASTQTRTATVEAVVPNPGHRLLPGAFVTMQISSGTVNQKLLIPASAVVTQGGTSFVWTAAGGAAAPEQYQCEKCHMMYSAADARKNNYHDPMDGGRLLPVASAPSPAGGSLTAHQVTVEVGASDGTWTEVTADALNEGTQVVTHGQAGLTEGARIVSTQWGADGPHTLPTAASARSGQTVYRCETCGMTYSAADAQKNNYHDPMDGGKLVPVTSAPSSDTMPGMKM